MIQTPRKSDLNSNGVTQYPGNDTLKNVKKGADSASEIGKTSSQYRRSLIWRKVVENSKSASTTRRIATYARTRWEYAHDTLSTAACGPLNMILNLASIVQTFLEHYLDDLQKTFSTFETGVVVTPGYDSGCVSRGY